MKQVFIIISYGLLALIIALWTRPLWRDLMQLSQVASHINNNNFDVSSKVSVHSPIKPIVLSINHMAQRIRYLLAEQKHLISAVSHELRTPLSRLRFSLALLPNVDQSKHHEFEQDISEIEHLIDEMLNYSRIEHLCQRTEKSFVVIEQLLQRQIEKHARSTDIKLHLNNTISMPVYLHGKLFERACQNLITNAIKYAHRQVQILAELNHGRLRVIVDDDGEGIAQAERARLFEPFSRVDESRNKDNGGYGLGLAIVKKACQWHQGNCTIADSPFGGARFIIDIPVLTNEKSIG